MAVRSPSIFSGVAVSTLIQSSRPEDAGVQGGTDDSEHLAKSAPRPFAMLFRP